MNLQRPGRQLILIALFGVLAGCDRTLDYCVSNQHELHTLEVGDRWAPALGTLDESHSNCLPLDGPSPLAWSADGTAGLALQGDGSLEAMTRGTFTLTALDEAQGAGLRLPGQVLPEGWQLVVDEPDVITLAVGEQVALKLDAVDAQGAPVPELWAFARAAQRGTIRELGCMPLNRNGQCRLEGLEAGSATLLISMGGQRETRQVEVTVAAGE